MLNSHSKQVSHQIKILVLDDEEAVLESLVDLLKSTFNDADILAAQNPKAALKILRGQGADILISDIRMPGLDGLELISILRSEGNLIPVILCSGFADKESAISAVKLQVLDFIEKPFRKDDLFLSVKKAILSLKGQQKHQIARLGLSRQQQKILELLLENKSNSEISMLLKLSEPTVKYHVGNLLKKFNSISRAELSGKIFHQFHKEN